MSKGLPNQCTGMGNEELPTAAQVSRMPQELKARIAARSRQKGSDYERTVAKRISAYFGFKWDDAFFRTKPHGHAQPEGDIKPINQMRVIWQAAKLGPLECKSRREWTFAQLFKNPGKSKICGYWVESNERTESDNSVVVFTKPGATDFVLHECEKCSQWQQARLTVQVHRGSKGFVTLTIVTLQTFLGVHWPDPQSVL